MASVMGGMNLKCRGEKMANFVENIWRPFFASKKRILLLAIATYIALC